MTARPPRLPTPLALLFAAATFLLALSGCLPSDDGEPTTVVIGTDAGASQPPPTDDAGSSSPVDSGDTPLRDTGTAPDTTSPDIEADTSEGADARTDSGGTTEPDTGSDESPEDCNTRQRFCDGSCTNVLSNPDHCGGCGSSCSNGADCVQGICQCAEGHIKCNGTCVDPTSNDDHCFECGNACSEGMTCRKSVCIEDDRRASAVEKINQVRQTPTDCDKYGVKPAGPKLEVNAELEKAAQAYAEKMAKHGFFAHEDPIDGSNFVQRVNRTNYTGIPIGENLARGLRQTAQRVVDGWTRSDEHCRVLANPDATEVGIGLAEPESGTFDAYWVMLTGKR
jgi:uncharacterized protein YkwD